MVKLTKRKGFNFFRSYYDVYNELKPRDKVAFMDALLDRQFLGVKPTKLKGLALFAYISQTNSIDGQVRGYEDKTGIKLTPAEPPYQPPTDGGFGTPLPTSIISKSKGKSKDKSKGNNPLSHFGIKNYEIITELDSEWQNRMIKKYKPSDFENEMKSFCDHLFDLGEVSKTVKDFKSHYVNLKNKRPDFLSNGKEDQWKPTTT